MDEDFFDIPEDDELAFLHLEKKFSDLLESRLNIADNNSPHEEYYQDYLVSVMAAGQACGVLELNKFDPINITIGNYENYRKIKLFVQSFSVANRIKISRRIKGYSVALDQKSRETVRHYISKLKEIAHKLEISDAKKEAIINKINDLEKEIDRPRTKLEVYAAIIVEGSAAIGQAGENLEPWRKWLDSIGKIFGLAKENERQQPQLPPPAEQKKLPSPNKQKPEFDDDIPF